MGFRWVFNDYGAPESRIAHILATNSEAFARGEAVSLVNGRWSKTANGAAIGGFANQTITAGTDKKLEVTLAREGDNFEASYTGTPDAAFLVGANTVDVSADGLSVLSSDVTGGALVVMDINTNKATCRVKVKNRQLS
ncbi:hypothetical protein [Paenibacillus ottowii]|uniref:Uncharacterized protein n=1 Tax=Paenibacillus ottowii TaxID=2315729 RepID=A0ABY3B0V4_9BACL|nr:hypothetical protein [Paenibacillus ottowii]TQR97316.1 hypothetical protein FKV70_18975 [Paenibacillus ottowii]